MFSCHHIQLIPTPLWYTATARTLMISPPPAPPPTPSAPSPGNHLTVINISYTQKHTPLAGVPLPVRPDENVAAVFALSLICSVFAHTVTTTAATVEATLTPGRTPGKKQSKLRPYILIFLFILSEYTVSKKYSKSHM